MENLESIILSPFFTAVLAVVGVYLFVILSREFFLWYSKANRIEAKLLILEEKIDELTQEISKLDTKAPEKIALPPIPAKQETQNFPITH